MRSTFPKVSALIVAVAAIGIIGCEDDNFINAVPVNALVSIQDQCDSASFNAAIGAGTCRKQGSVTFTEFNDELAATQQVAGWRFVPPALRIQVGQRIIAVNDGGEEHTFTEVAAFGGGIVPQLNTASGYLTPAPECLQLTSVDRIPAGARSTTDEARTVGTEHYQCCIHPWMRANVTVVP
jgi:hypothetical protein